MDNIIQQEIDSWSWLENVVHDLEGYEQLKQIGLKFKKELQKATPSESKLASFEEQIKELSKDRKIFLSQSVTGRFINSIEDKAVALSCLRTLLNQQEAVIEGVVTAILYKKGLRKKLLPEKQQFLDLMAEIRSQAKKQQEALENESIALEQRARESEQLVISLDDRVKKAIQEAESKKDTFVSRVETELQDVINLNSKQYENQIKELNQSLDNEKNKAKEKILNFIESYKSEIQLKAPVSYWEENKQFHRKRAKYFGIASLIIAPIIFALIAWVGWEVLSTDSIVWGKVGVVVFATSLAVWLIRILVRMYLSHNHLELSSQERIIMTKSYLALLSEGGASSPEERQLVLQSIFRPSATGIISDDAAPPNVIELINRIHTK
ncbi:DUF6161 domain-containing protein [Vibrio vulnificus]|nr:hypothetical protein [Vibrio vulnificus]